MIQSQNALAELLRGALHQAKNGAWLTSERAVLYPAILIGFYLLAIVGLFWTGNGMLDWRGEPIGTDFSMMWSAGKLALDGRPEAAYSLPQLGSMERHLFGPSAPFYGWHYPPYFLGLAAVAATAPYFLSLAIWQGATFLLFLKTIRLMVPRFLPSGRVMILALAFPAAFVNLAHGQNGFLTASLMGIAVLFLERRPYLAGCLFALLAYKPQFALAIPVALLAGSHWRAIASGVATWVLTTVATILLFGGEIWTAFFRSLSFTRSVVIEQGATGWEKIQSVFSAVRMAGGGIATGYTIQTVVALGVLLALGGLWRSQADPRLKGAALLVGTLLTTPYCLDYDMVVFGPAIALMVSYGLSRGFVRFEITLLCVLWASPIMVRSISAMTSVPVGAFLILGFFTWIIARRASRLAATCVGKDASLPPLTGFASGRSHA